jgi:hypothetical protein
MIIQFSLATVTTAQLQSWQSSISSPARSSGNRFAGPTVNRLAAVAFRLREVELLMTTFRELCQLHRDKDYEATNVEVTTGNINLVKQSRHEERQASWAYNRIPALIESLLAAGGSTPPPDLETPVSDDTLPKLLSNPFVG